MEFPDFLHDGLNPIKFKGGWKFLEWGMVKNGCGLPCDVTLKLTVSEEWTDGINLIFLHVDTDLQKLKVDQKIFVWA